MKKLIIKFNGVIAPDKLEEMRRDIERQFYNSGVLVLDSSCSYETVECDTVKAVDSDDGK